MDVVTNFKLMLVRNPGDIQSAGFLLSSEALQAGDDDQACAVFAAEAIRYPPYYCELALADILRKEWVLAVTALRRGFTVNSYIAGLLGGNASPAPLAILQGTNMVEPTTASDYID